MRTVTVTGLGAVAVPRDAAVVRVSLVHRDTTVTAALAGAESAREVAVEVAVAHVDRAAVASQGLEVWPAHDDTGTPSGFEARHALVLRCGDLAVAGALVTALAEGVGDRLRVEGVGLAAREHPDAGRTARERAFDDARARAEHLAGLADAALGEVVGVSDGSAPVGSGAGRDTMAASATREVAFEPGEVDLTESVTVTWELVPVAG